MTFPLLTTMYGLPLLAVLVIFFVPERRALAIKIVSLTASAAALGLAVWLFFAYDRGVGGLQFVERVPWLGVLGVNYFVGANGVNVMLLLLTGVIITAGVLASWDVTYRPKEFFILLLTLTTGVFGVFMAYNLFLFFLFYEVSVLPMYLLIGIWGTGKKEYAAMKLTLYLMAGSALILAGLLGLYFASGKGSFDFDILSTAAYDPLFQRVFFPILFVGFGTLAALWPFHTWSPDGHSSAPTAVSMLHAGVLMKLGAYGCLLVPITLLPGGARFWLPSVAFLSVINIVYGSLSAVAQRDLKYIVAYSSVSHMGIVMLGLASMNEIALNGAVLQMFSHGIMTGLFFGLVGMIYGRSHTRMVNEQGGLAARTPALAAFFVLTGLTSLGLPGLSGFPAELSVFLGAFRAYPVVTVICVTGIVFTAFYVLRVVQRLFFGRQFLAHPASAQSTTLGFGDANRIELTALSLLMLFILAVGLYPLPFTTLIGTAVAPIAAKLGGM
ncbi:MAG TPA: NADH-quinone oxidoreductase subunit M [Spirochaetia bacterium]|nr:NADH-quinone oxidoreductase subunit M [Spirochaetia bacterium]